MKVSQEQKSETRQKILRAAVAVIIEKGLENSTMREIAKRAKVGDATIYNYFPTKWALLYGYYQDHLERCLVDLKAVQGFATFTLQEQLQTLLETQLSLFLPDREFVQATYRPVFFAWGMDHNRLKPIRTQFITTVEEMFQSAVQNGEISEMVFDQVVYQLMWEYAIGMVGYWMQDSSDQFADSSVLIDKSLDLAVALLKAGIPNKLFGMVSFLFKNHILSRMALFKDQAAASQRFKKEFMGMGA